MALRSEPPEEDADAGPSDGAAPDSAAAEAATEAAEAATEASGAATEAAGAEGGAEAPVRTLSFLTVFSSIMLPMFMALIDQTIVSTALPAIAAALGSVETVSWVVIAYLVTATVAAPVYGRLGDLLGRRRLMVAALLVAMAGSVVCMTATSLPHLLIGRVVQGLGGGGLMTLCNALLGEAIAPRERPRYQGYLSSIGVTASMFGPLAGGFLAEHYGWRSVFLLNVPLGLLALVMVLRLPARRPTTDAFRFDVLGLVLLALAIVPLLVALQFLQHIAEASGLQIALLIAVAAGAAVLLVRQERRADPPLLPLAMLAHPAIWRSDVLAAFHGASVVALVTYTPLYLRVSQGLAGAEIGFLLVPLTIGIGLGSMATGYAVSRTGRSAIFPSVGLVATSASVFVLAWAAPSIGQGALWWLLFTISLLLGSVMPVVQVTVMFASGPAMLGAAAGSVQLSRSVGAAIGTALAGVVLFLALGAGHPGTLQGFEAAIVGGRAALDAEPTALRSAIAADIDRAFSLTFAAIACFSALATVFAWTLPLRRL